MTYENIFGLGYERATEPGLDVEILNTDGSWKARPDDYPLFKRGSFVYRRPIKLQVGHRYVRRDGVIVRVTNKIKAFCGGDYEADDGEHRYENGRWSTIERNHRFDLVTHIEEPETNEEPMKDTVTVKNVNMGFSEAGNVNVFLTYAQIEAAHAEMVRQKAENEIKEGDILRHKGSEFMFIASQARDSMRQFSAPHLAYFGKDNLEKVTGTPEFMAQLRAKLEGK